MTGDQEVSAPAPATDSSSARADLDRAIAAAIPYAGVRVLRRLEQLRDELARVDQQRTPAAGPAYVPGCPEDRCFVRPGVEDHHPGPGITVMEAAPAWPAHGVGSLGHGATGKCGDDCNNGQCRQGLMHAQCTPECTALVIWDLRTGGAWTPGAANLAGAGPDDLVVLVDLVDAGGPPAKLPQPRPVHHYDCEEA